MSAEDTVDRLVEVGFSRYEARAYLGLLGAEPLTGYALANATGLPQPKVYETLRRLVARGAVLQTGTDPARFVAIAPEQLLHQVRGDFSRRVNDAQVELERFHPAPQPDGMRLFRSARDRASVVASATDLVADAAEHVYLSGSSAELAGLAPAVAAAQQRGVRFDVLHFGPPPFAVTRGRLFAHGSTDGVVFRHHQAHHLAVVVDSVAALWAVAPAGADWQAMWAADTAFVALVKGYVRHDIYVQQIYADMPEILVEHYGPGLAGLITPSPVPEGRPGSRRPA